MSFIKTCGHSGAEEMTIRGLEDRLGGSLSERDKKRRPNKKSR